MFFDQDVRIGPHVFFEHFWELVPLLISTNRVMTLAHTSRLRTCRTLNYNLMFSASDCFRFREED